MNTELFKAYEKACNKYGCTFDMDTDMNDANEWAFILRSTKEYYGNKFDLKEFDECVRQKLKLLHLFRAKMNQVNEGFDTGRAQQHAQAMADKGDPTELLDQVLGIYIPLIATNCAVLGVALLNVQQSKGFVQSVFYGFGASAGFALVLVMFAAIRERLEAADTPAPFRGTAIALMTAGMMSLAFMGFSGMARP